MQLQATQAAAGRQAHQVSAPQALAAAEGGAAQRRQRRQRRQQLRRELQEAQVHAPQVAGAGQRGGQLRCQVQPAGVCTHGADMVLTWC